MRRISSRFLPLAPLAGCTSLLLAPALAAHAGESPASAPATAAGMTITVSNCNDRGPGSLRAAVAGALSGDTIDMRNLTCRRINLTSGAIMIPQDDLTLRGGSGMTVDANRLSSVFRHSGTGWLRIRGMTIARGFYQHDMFAYGGCVYSAGSIELAYSLVHWCVATSPRYPLGSGVYATGAMAVTNSQVLSNTASRWGPAVYALNGRLTTYRSRICSNRGGGVWAKNGGLHANYTTFSNNNGTAVYSSLGRRNVIANSTISGNTSGGSTLAFMRSGQIINSTISGNTSGRNTVWMDGRKSIVNSTIAFNRHSDFCDAYFGMGAVSFDTDPYRSLHIESTIIAGNTCYGNAYRDIYSTASAPGIQEPILEGTNNLITSSNVPLPPDTIFVDPRLAPLADNGGRTKTHALLDDSPAIDMGNNAADLTYDQRGTGFPRVNGTQPDIGAYER